jgi:hypothetical protein
MMRASTARFVLASFVLAFSPAHATDSLCEAVALHGTTKSQAFPYELKSGDRIDAITQYRVNKKSRITSFCSHGGGCYPATALRLTNCKVNKGKPDDDGEEIYYGLTLIRSRVPPAALRQNDVELKLLEMGMCNSCADNAAAFYVKRPRSRCASLVRQALEGSPSAMAKLQETPPYCTLS